MTITIPRLVDAALDDQTAERVRRSHAEAIQSLVQSLRDLEARAVTRRWAQFYMSTDQPSAATGDLVVFDRVLAQTGGFTAGADGVLVMPPGFYRLTGGLLATPSTAIQVVSTWYRDPTVGNTIVDPGQAGVSTAVTNSDSGGLAGAAIAYLFASEEARVGVRFAIAAGTASILASGSKALIEEISPRLVT